MNESYFIAMSRKSTIQEELKVSKPFPSAYQEGAVSLLRTADMVRRHLSSVVESQGVTLQQYNVLRILRGAGDKGIPTLEIADRMIEQTPGITRLLDRLESKLLVRRLRCDRDRRQVLCWITPDGLELLKRLDDPLKEAEEAALGDLEVSHVRELITLLNTIRAAHQEI